MTLCKYFLQGTCRFGNNCRFEHSYNSGSFNNHGGTSVLRNKASGQQFSSNYFTQNSGQVRSNSSQGEIMQIAINELNLSEQGGQWPLSCFAPFKEQSCYPGIEDHSPEEIRWLMYSTIQSGGNVQECKRQIQELYTRNKVQKHSLMNPTAETYSIIDNLYKGQKVDQFPSTGSTTTFVSGNSVLGPAPVSSAFTFSLTQLGSAPDQNPTPFGGSAPIFGNPVQVVTNTNSVFGTPFQSGTTSTGSIFGNSNQTVVGNPSSITFGNLPSSTEPAASFNNPSRGFSSGSNTYWAQSDKQLQDNSIYTLMTELSEEEKNVYNLKTFTMGKVPTKPPPKEMCT